MVSVRNPDVSVVIPSVGRTQLKAAVRSARNQTVYDMMEIIVVFDLKRSDVTSGMLDGASGADQVLFSDGREGACHARNLGVNAARGSWIAFLDDDDTWMPRKIEIQLAEAALHRAAGVIPIVGCRATLVQAESSRPQVTNVPAGLISTQERIDEYLFRARRPGSRRASFFTSSVLAPTEVCKKVPWAVGLARHQDWDWLLRVADHQNVVFLQSGDALLNYSLGSTDSISATSDWKTSVLWAQLNRQRFSAAAFSDFLCAQPLRYAIQARDLRGVVSIVHQLLALRKIPGLGPILIGMAGIIPRRSLQRLMTIIK